MTTSYVIDNTGKFLVDQLTNMSATPLAYGAGHIDRVQLKGNGDSYLQATLELSARKRTRSDYPSFMAIFSGKQDSPAVKKFRRVMTNVGNDSSVYHATTAYGVRGFSIVVEPTTLSFTHKYQKLGFSMEIKLDEEVLSEQNPEVYGFLKWTDEHNHVVSSPVEILKL